MEFEDATVIVCSRDRASHLRNALPAIMASLREGDRLLVVDSYSVADSTSAVAHEFGIECIRATRPGLSHARNVGLATVETPLVLFTDDDCEPSRSWITELVPAFGDAAVGFATGRVSAKGSAGRLKTSTSSADHPAIFGSHDPIDAMGHGANMGFRREALVEVGGFDELLGAGAPLRSAEDWDAFARLSRRGWLGSYKPLAVVMHSQWRDEKAALKTRYGYSKGAAALAMKSARLGDARGRTLLRERITEQGLKRFVRMGLRLRFWAALDAAGTMVGCAVGAWYGLRLPLDGDFFDGGQSSILP